MKSLLIGSAILVALAAIAILAGSLLPREHLATVRARYAAAPDRLWSVLSDPARAASWRTDLKSVELLPPTNGQTAWREESRFGKVEYVMAELSPPGRMITRISNENLPYGGQWEYMLTPLGDGSELSITERGFVKSALFRLMARLFFGYTSSLEGYHRALGKRFGEVVSPEIIASGR